MWACSGETPVPQVREDRDFAGIRAETSGVAVEVQRIGYRPDADNTVWEVELICREPAGCEGLVTASVEYEGDGLVNHVTLTGRVTMADGETATLSRVERGTIAVSAVRRIDVNLRHVGSGERLQL
jgi:hypothetical protein